MPQRLNFPLLPKADDPSYWPKLTALIEFIDDARPNRRDLREFMQDQGTWDRDTFEGFFDLLQIEAQGKRYRLGRLPRQLMDASDEDERKLLVTRRIVSENPILVRSMFDALEERLFSDAELWRYLTSHVYPGEHIGGAEFREWMRWMRLCGVVRVIGIRFGFCKNIDEVKRIVERIDVEEELLEEATGEGGDDEDERDAAGSPPAQAPTSETTSETTSEPAPVDPAEAPAPPEPATEPATEQAPEATNAESPDAEAADAPAAPEMAEIVPLRRFRAQALGDAEVRDNLERLRGWWRGFDERAMTRAEDFGVMPLAYEAGDKRVFLLQLVCVALVVAGDPRRADRFGFFTGLNRARFFHRLIEDRGEFFAVLDELEWFKDDVGQRALLENLVHLAPLRDALVADPDLPDALSAMGDPAELLAAVRRCSFTSPIEGLWVVREMVRMGLWGGEAHPAIAAAAAVPSPTVVETAWRLGLHDRPQADDAPAALSAAQALAAHLGPDDGFDAPLAHFAAAHGCRRACPNAPVCPYHCREKTLT